MTALIDLPGCIEPSGDFLSSCRYLELDAYKSTDSYVPAMCNFEAKCDDGQTNDLVPNSIFIPINTHFTQMRNVAGHLAYGKNILSNALAAENPEEYSAIMDNLQNGIALISAIDQEIAPFKLPGCDFPLIAAPNYEKPVLKYKFKANTYECKAPTGSYSDSCRTEISRYISTDKNLANTELCEIHLECKNLEGKPVKSSTVYFNIGEKEVSTTVQKLENCNGAIVIGNLDNQCSGSKGSEHIKNKAEKDGKTGRFKSN